MANTNKKVSGFKMETIQKIVSSLVVLINFYLGMLKAGKKVQLSISAGNRKIGRCMNVSLAPIVTCGNCKECKHFCYDVKACCQYKNVRNARAKNTALFQYSRDEFFRQLHEQMAKKRSNFFLRFHVSGEIKDIDHLNRIIETARMFPWFKIWTYTKMYHVVNKWIDENGKENIPENLSIMFSEWKGLPIVNPHGMPVFRCVSPDEETPDMFECPGCCDYCKENNRGCVVGESSYVHLH